MPRTCCGKLRTTKFCPDCGAKLGETPTLDQLLAHCRKTQAAHESRMTTWLEQGNQKEVDSQARAANKWRAWADALEALITQTPPDVPRS